MSDSEAATSNLPAVERGFFGKLANGDFGLAKTYWLYGVLAGVIVQIIARSVPSVGVLVLLILAYTVYEIPVLMGVWRASNKYQGNKVWAVLAKAAVILGIFMLGFGLLAVIGLLGQV